MGKYSYYVPYERFGKYGRAMKYTYDEMKYLLQNPDPRSWDKAHLNRALDQAIEGARMIGRGGKRAAEYGSRFVKKPFFGHNTARDFTRDIFKGPKKKLPPTPRVELGNDGKPDPRSKKSTRKLLAPTGKIKTWDITRTAKGKGRPIKFIL